MGEVRKLSVPDGVTDVEFWEISGEDMETYIINLSYSGARLMHVADLSEARIPLAAHRMHEHGVSRRKEARILADKYGVNKRLVDIAFEGGIDSLRNYVGSAEEAEDIEKGQRLEELLRQLVQNDPDPTPGLSDAPEPAQPSSMQTQPGPGDIHREEYHRGGSGIPFSPPLPEQLRTRPTSGSIHPSGYGTGAPGPYIPPGFRPLGR